MVTENTIAWIFAHPDDESFGSACTVYEAVRRGNKAVLLVATPGDAGKTGRLGPMTKEQLAEKRKQELKRAAEIIGLSVVEHLNYSDGQLKDISRSQLIGDVARFVNNHRAKVVVTFPEDGSSGHTDHIAIHHAVKEAVLNGRCPSVQKLYFYASRALQGEGRPPAVKVDCRPHWEIKVKALLAHESQILSTERIFGDLRKPNPEIPGHWKYESFFLAWERGVSWPEKKESFLTDDLLE